MNNGLAVHQAVIQPRYAFDEMVQIAGVAARSGLFKMTEPQILTLMMLCESEGLHPIKAIQLYDIIDGRPSMKAVALLARFLESGGSVEWIEQSTTAAEATFTHPRTCPKGVTVRYTLDDAKCAGIAHKDNWKKNPADMLVARVCSRGAKRANPACILGMDLPEPEEQPAVTETAARTALVDTLAKRRERPVDAHPSVAATVAELKAAEQPQKAPEPSTEWGKVFEEAVLDFNQSLAGLAEQNPANLKLRDAMVTQHAINGVIRSYVEAGVIDEASLKGDGGRRSGKKVAEKLDYLWREDRGEVEAALAKYLGGKMTELMGTPEPAEVPNGA